LLQPDALRHDAEVRFALPVLLTLLVIAGCSKDVKQEAAQLTGGDPARGVAAMDKYGCGACHVIPGVKDATATIGPPLSGIASRAYLAGQLQNTPEHMLRWIQRPQEINEETAMPDLGVTDQDARDIAAHLYTLR
jgi:cytochrome c2